MKCITTHIDLVGPVDGNARLECLFPGGEFYWPGSCITGHTAQFQFQYQHAPLKYAIWRMQYSLYNKQTGIYNQGRYLNALYSMDSGPTNLQVIAMLDSDTVINPAANVHNHGADVTNALNALITAGIYKQIGWKVSGDNTNTLQVVSNRLELVWDLT